MKIISKSVHAMEDIKVTYNNAADVFNKMIEDNGPVAIFDEVYMYLENKGDILDFIQLLVDSGYYYSE